MEVGADMSQNGQNVNAEEEELSEFTENFLDLMNMLDKVDVDVNRLKTNSIAIISKVDGIIKDTDDIQQKMNKECYGTFEKLFALLELVSRLRQVLLEVQGKAQIIDGEASRIGFLVDDLNKKKARINSLRK